MAIDKSKLIPTGMVYSRTGKLPLESDRLFDTLALAQAYVDNADQSAYVGLTVSVVADTEENNGLYYVKAIGTADAAGVLEKVGAGSGSTTVNNFVIGEDGKIEGAVNPGQVIYVTEGSEQYPAGPYIVTGDGTVAKLGTTSATGDIAGDVEVLKSDVDAVEGEVEGIKTNIEGINSSIESLETNSATKDEVSSAEERLNQAITDEATARGEAIQAVQDQVTANAQAIEALNAATTFGGTGTYEQMQASADVKPGTVWVISGDEAYVNKEFVYDGTQWVELGDTTAEGQRLTTLESEMAEVKPAVEQAKTDIQGLQSAILTKVEAEEGKGLSTNDFTNELKAKLDGIAEEAQVNVLEGVQVDGVDLEIVDKKVNIDLSAFAKSEEVNGSFESVNNSLAAKLDKTATVNGQAFDENQAVVIGSGDIKLSGNISTEKEADRYTTDDTIQGVLESMNARIESIDSDIQSALEGGVTGIEMGNGISVDSTIATKPKVSIKLAAVNPGMQVTADGLSVKIAEGTALQVTEDGMGIYWQTI